MPDEPARRAPLGSPPDERMDRAIQAAGRAIAGPGDYMEDWREYDEQAVTAVRAFLRALLADRPDFYGVGEQAKMIVRDMEAAHGKRS